MSVRGQKETSLLIFNGEQGKATAGGRSRRVRLEQYLRAKKEKSPNELFSVTRLMADLGMTEAEVFSASVASRHVARAVRRDRQTGFAAEVLFQYREVTRGARKEISDEPSVFTSQDSLRDADKGA
jgi:hypothetical protein